MGILLAFAPFIVFAIIERLAGPIDGLIGGALVSAALLMRDLLTPSRTPKILEIGTALLFVNLAFYTLLSKATWSMIGVRLTVDAGLLLIVLLSIAMRRPFTLQYAREQIAPQFWNSPEFIRTNYIITAVWAVAFAVMVGAELALLYVPRMPRQVGIIAIVAALVGAVKFTGWYPERKKNQAAE
jgi:hypothetical protein